MGGCCSASGTANGATPSPGAPPPRDKAAKAAMTPASTADAKAPPAAAAPGKKAPAAAATSKAAEASPPAAAAHPEKKEEVEKKAPPAAAAKDAPKEEAATKADTFHPAPPPFAAAAAASSPDAEKPAEPPRSPPPPPPSSPAVPEPEPAHAKHEDDHHASAPHAHESSTAHLGGTPTSTQETKEFNSGGEAEVTHTPPPPPPPPPAAAAAAAEPETKAERPALEFALPPPAVESATPVNITPERVPAPRFAPHEAADEADNTRGPSTARIEEVPPTPVRESANGVAKSLPADDARVLQRVPPPPPPPLSAKATETPTEAEADRESKVEKSTPLADILRRQQEEKQRYPTALTTDAKDDAPLEISMEEDRHEASSGAAAASKYVDPNATDDKAPQEHRAMDKAAPMPVSAATSVDTRFVPTPDPHMATTRASSTTHSQRFAVPSADASSDEGGAHDKRANSAESNNSGASSVASVSSKSKKVKETSDSSEARDTFTMADAPPQPNAVAAAAAAATWDPKAAAGTTENATVETRALRPAEASRPPHHSPLQPPLSSSTATNASTTS
uniref:Uncharacterized protein n=1 Tax=Angomonas deanei TaxID=59799 RepID=C6K3N5_9TRYP|nr:hypothetical protein CDFL5P16_10 [Angomonas deanei]